MAVISVKNPSTLKIKLNHGSDHNGKAIIKSKSYSSIKPDATIEDLYEVAKSIVSLQDHDLYDVVKIDNESLSE